MTTMTANLDRPGAGRLAGVGGAALAAAVEAHQRDLEFLELLRSLRRHGGLARAGALWHRRTSEMAAPVRFEWGGAVWLPMFQFDPHGDEVRPIVVLVVSELRPQLDGWALARWFAEPNAWLANRRPVDAIDDDAAGVHSAARADRFVVRG